MRKKNCPISGWRSAGLGDFLLISAEWEAEIYFPLQRSRGVDPLLPVWTLCWTSVSRSESFVPSHLLLKSTTGAPRPSLLRLLAEPTEHHHLPRSFQPHPIMQGNLPCCSSTVQCSPRLSVVCALRCSLSLLHRTEEMNGGICSSLQSDCPFISDI